MRSLLLRLCNCFKALPALFRGCFLSTFKFCMMDSTGEKRGEGLEINFSIKRRRPPFKAGADLEGTVHLTIEDSDGKEALEVKVEFSVPK